MSLISEHARLEKNLDFPACLPLLEPARLLDFLGFFPARYRFNRENVNFSTLLALIRSCSFIKFLGKIPPACLLKPARLLETEE